MGKQTMFKPRPLIELTFPIGGLNRNAAFQSQPPFTTPYCVNVRPFDQVNLAAASVHGGRQRGGARPGMVKAYADRIGTGPIQFTGFSSVLSTAGVSSHILLAIAGGTLYQNASGSMAAVTGGPQFNATAPQLQGTQVGQKFYIADYRATNVVGTNGTIASTNRLSDPAIADWTALSIDTAKDVVWISGNVDTEANIYPITSVSSGYIVFTGTMTNQSGSVNWQIGRIPKIFDPSTPTGVLGGLGGSLPIPASNYRTGTVSIAAGIVTLSGGTWPALSAALLTAGVSLTIPNASGIGTTSYLVKTRDSNTQLTLTDTTDDANCSAVEYKLEWTSDYYGIPPLGCPLCCTYRGRLVLAGPGAIWYMSRVLNPNDWDYGYDPADPSRAVGGTATTTGGIPDPILALIPHSDQYLLFGCERSLWLLTGDPAFGGSIQALSRDVGVLGPNAWCSLPDGSVVFLSRDGIYQVKPGGQSPPEPISRPKMPVELTQVDWKTNTISMSYDVAARGINLAITPTAGTVGTHYFIDHVTGSFWPVTMPNAMQPTAMVRYSPNSTVASYVILAGYDGYLRSYSSSATTDDGTAIASMVCYGPLRPGGPGYYGEIAQIAADLDPNGQGVTWGIFAGDSAQAAVAAAVAGGTASSAPWTGTWTAGRNHRQFPRAVGGGLVIMLSGTYAWSVEGIQLDASRKGPIR